MTKRENKILARELGKLGAISGAVGGGLDGAIGGGLGANLAARLLPNDTFELDIEIAAKPRAVLKKAFNILSRTGKITEGIEPPSDLPTLYAVIGSGFLNLNPALVRVEIVAVSKNSTQVTIRGVAKEGLIKQHAGEKAARKIADLLEQAFF